MMIIDFHLCHEMASVWMLYSLPLSYIFKTNISNVNIPKNGERAKKCHIFIGFDICHLMPSLQMLHSVTDLNFRCKISNKNILEMVKDSKTMICWTFIGFDIFHRMASFRMLYSVTLTSIFKVKKSNMNIANGERWCKKCKMLHSWILIFAMDISHCERFTLTRSASDHVGVLENVPPFVWHLPSTMVSRPLKIVREVWSCEKDPKFQ